MKIGRIVRVLEDSKRKETLVKCDDNRKICISFYYPVDENWKESRQAHYIDLYSPEEDKFINKFKDLVLFESNDGKMKHLKTIKTNIYNNAPISEENVNYPVIIQSTGLGAPRDYMTFNIEQLIKAGYVVFTIGHFYDSMLNILPNGEMVETQYQELTQSEKREILEIRKDDILFLLSNLETLKKQDPIMKNKLDLERIGVIGHSLGGAAIFKATQCSSMIKAAVLFDASLQFFNLNNHVKESLALSTPVLNFRRGTFDYETSMKMFIDYLKDKADGERFKKGILINDAVLRDSDQQQKNLFNYLSGYKSFIKLNSSKHMIFTDYPIIIGETMESENLSIKTAHQLINDLTIRFLDEFICHIPGKYSKFIMNNEYITIFK